ncbi:hypothetical protein Trydic_g5859 [Trypoxylus dichotomus]
MEENSETERSRLSNPRIHRRVYGKEDANEGKQKQTGLTTECIEVSGGLRSRRSEEFRTKEERRRTIPLRAILNQNMAVLKLAGGGPYRVFRDFRTGIRSIPDDFLAGAFGGYTYTSRCM